MVCSILKSIKTVGKSQKNNVILPFRNDRHLDKLFEPNGAGLANPSSGVIKKVTDALEIQYMALEGENAAIV